MQIRRPSIFLTGGIFIILCLTVAAAMLARQFPYVDLQVRSQPGQPVMVSDLAGQQYESVRAFSAHNGKEVAYPSADYHLSRRTAAQLPPDVIERNDAIAAIARQGATLRIWTGTPSKRAGSTDRVVKPTPLTTPFWQLIFTGLVGAVVGLWVGTLRPDMPAAQALAVSGVGLLFAAYPVGIILNNQLLLSGTVWLNLMRSNFLGIQLFAGSIVFVFAVYPVRLLSLRAALAMSLVLLGAMTAVAFVPQPLSPRHIRHMTIVFLDLALILCFAAWQWRRTQFDPVGRAYLRLVGATAVLAMGGWVATTFGPQLYGREPLLDVATGAMLMVLIYGAIAFGIVQGYMFDVDRWAWTLLASAVTLLAIFLIEAGLVVAFGFGPGPSASIAFTVAGCVWLIARNRLLDRLMGRQRGSGQLTASAHRIVLAATAEERFKRWQAALQDEFQPLDILPAADETNEARLGEYGLLLFVPAPRFGPGLTLRSARRGRALFVRSDCDVVDQFRALCDRIDEDRQAYDRGMREERERIAQDLHDDVSGRLLTGLHRDDVELVRGDLRAALADLRLIVSGMQGQRLELAAALADIRGDCDDRLSAAGIRMSWDEQISPSSALVISYPNFRAMNAIMREITTNVIRHSGADRMCVRAELGATAALAVTVSDNGVGFDRPAKGNGLSNMLARTEMAGGSFLVTGTNGTMVKFSLPLR